MPSRFPWASLPDEELLELRLKDLKVTVEGTWLELCLRALQDELEQRGLRVRPHAWISDEWFSPDTTPGIAIPFYLAHPRLMRLERKMIIDVEGGTVPECMRILRHEAGHVIQHSYAAQPPPALAAAVRPLLHPLSRTSTARTPPARTTSSICGCGTPRAIRTRISPRPSRCGCARAPTGASATRAGRPSRSSNMSMS